MGFLDDTSVAGLTKNKECAVKEREAAGMSEGLGNRSWGELLVDEGNKEEEKQPYCILTDETKGDAAKERRASERAFERNANGLCPLSPIDKAHQSIAADRSRPVAAPLSRVCQRCTRSDVVVKHGTVHG
jgi:hypothetical protein